MVGVLFLSGGCCDWLGCEAGSFLFCRTQARDADYELRKSNPVWRLSVRLVGHARLLWGGVRGGGVLVDPSRELVGPAVITTAGRPNGYLA